MDDTSEKPAGKTVKDRAKDIGRDGAYLEVDACDLVKASRNGDLDKAKMVVIKFGRLEMSDSVQVAQLKKVVEDVMAKNVKGGPGGGEMSDEQGSFHALLQIVKKGLYLPPQ
jgi:hypothetical protein